MKSRTLGSTSAFCFYVLNLTTFRIIVTLLFIFMALVNYFNNSYLGFDVWFGFGIGICAPDQDIRNKEKSFSNTLQ